MPTPTAKKRELTFDFSVGRFDDLKAIEGLVADAIRQSDFDALSIERPSRLSPSGIVRPSDTLTLLIKFKKY